MAHSLAGSGVSHHAPGCFCCAKAAWAFAHPARRIEKAKLCRPSAPLTQGGRGIDPDDQEHYPQKKRTRIRCLFRNSPNDIDTNGIDVIKRHARTPAPIATLRCD